MVTESQEDRDLEFKSADYILFVASLVFSSIVGKLDLKFIFYFTQILLILQSRKNMEKYEKI